MALITLIGGGCPFRSALLDQLSTLEQVSVIVVSPAEWRTLEKDGSSDAYLILSEDGRRIAGFTQESFIAGSANIVQASPEHEDDGGELGMRADGLFDGPNAIVECVLWVEHLFESETRSVRGKAVVGRVATNAFTVSGVDKWLQTVADEVAKYTGAEGCIIVRTVEDGRHQLMASAGNTATAVKQLPGGDSAEKKKDDGVLRLPIGEGDAQGYLVLEADTSRLASWQSFLDDIVHVLNGFFRFRSIREDIRLTEAKAQSILNTTVDAIVTITEDGIIQSFNSAAERIFGYRASEVKGKNVRVLMPEPYRSEHDDYIQNYLETGHRRIIGIGREVRGLRKDGSTFPMDLAVSEVHLGDRRIFTGIIRDITERRTLEREVLQASDQERRRIGQDMHDGLGQMLTGIGLISKNLANALDREDHPKAADMQEVADLIREADEYARTLARGLIPVELEMGGLTGALQRLCEQAERLFDIDCTLEHAGDKTVGDADVATHFYRIAQEALSNAVRHGKASFVQITLDVSNGQVRLRVRDNGKGLPEDSVSPVTLNENEFLKRGMGIRIMHHRARIVGAQLDIHGQQGEGTVVTCTRNRPGSTRGPNKGDSTPPGPPGVGGGCPIHHN